MFLGDYKADLETQIAERKVWAKDAYGDVWQQWFKLPRPALPPTPEQCGTYADYMCRYGRSIRGGVQAAPECERDTVLPRCEELVGRLSSGAVTQYQAAIGAARITEPEGVSVQEVEAGRFIDDPDVQAAVLATLPQTVTETLEVREQERKRQALFSAALKVGLVAGVFFAGLVWWKRRKR